MDVPEIQRSLRDSAIDGWLFYDVHNRDQIACNILGLDQNKLTTRRWYYLIPSSGRPVKVVHRVEKQRLAELSGDMIMYSSWRELHDVLREILRTCKKVAMQYSPFNNIPSIAYVDAGTVELIRSFDVEVVSSANLVQLFEARVDEKGVALHREAGEKVQKIKDRAFELIIDAVKSSRRITEYDVQQFILNQFARGNLTCESFPPLVAVNEHAADPHFEVAPRDAYEIRRDDRVLIDLWAKVTVPDGIYYDITWCGYMGEAPPEEYVTIFGIVVQARKLAKNFIIKRLKQSQKIFGWQVDDVCRDYISEKGYGDYFTHRTGHSIHTQIHGNGVNIDNLETRDDREIIPGTCFSIEPGIYKDDIGARSEISVLIDSDRSVIVVGEEQEYLILL